MTRFHIEKPQPLITNQIEFKSVLPSPPPSLTCHIEFTPELLADRDDPHIPEEAISPPNASRANNDTQPTGSTDGGTPPQNASGSRPNAERGPDASGQDSGQEVRTPTAASHRNNLNPKPSGEPGRPGSGGYCLGSVLIETYGWSKEEFNKFSDAVRSEAQRKLDMTISYRNQDKAVIEAICSKMSTVDSDGNRWPDLVNYDQCWPVHSVLKLALKYSAEASRRVSAKKQHYHLRRAMRGLSPGSEV